VCVREKVCVRLCVRERECVREIERERANVCVDVKKKRKKRLKEKS
jgi:hypothetical protein